nr:hypothetical protein [Nitrosopumilaceae archaeon]NIU86133.1 hypothetical protein [Nitrosopumilaceae archaeon]NIX61281.1 hypothetical protein [Nitrosopumilaceae archaeon]
MSKIDIQKLKAMGFNLMPLKKESKEPIPGVSWKRLQNEKYNGEFPDSCNVAVICGQISDNLFVVDLDKDDLFEQFKEYHDKTYIVKTGRGYHIYFKSNTFCPPNKKFDDYRFRHIDIKSDGGYVLAEGSIHPDTKKPYECISSKPILRINPKEIMDKLQEMGFNVQKQSFEDISKGVIEGGRNDATFKYACYLVRDKGLYGEALRKEVEELNKRHKPPLPQSEIDIILKQAEGYEAKNVKKSKEIISMESLRERLKKMDQESINLSSDLPEFTRVLGEDTVEGIIKEVKGDIPIHRSQKLNLRDINPVLHEGILVEFDAMITAIGNRQTYNVEADFVCPGKGEVKHLTCDAYRRMETPHCAKHKCRYNIDLDSRKTVFVQQMNIQEFLESAKNNSPVHYQAEIYGDNVGKAFMGERKTFLGKFRSLPPKGNKNTYNDVVFDILEMKDLDQQPGCMPTNEELEKWKNDPKIFDKVVNSFAPDVLIDPTLIESVVLYMSGGTTINGKRALIHECIIGDAQLGKSEIAKRVHDIILGSGYVDGTNCSVPGITVGMATMYDGMQIPQAGTLPQHTGYPVVFDEGDKASPEVLKSLYNCMESGFATLTKVGYAGTTYPTKNEILFLANPKNGKFSLKGNRTIMDNFSMETPFISRFDIIWLLIDKNDPEEDKRIRNHIRNYRQKVG